MQRSPRLLILGNTGSGKTTLAKHLADRHQLVRLDLDTVVFAPDRIAEVRPNEAIRADLDRFVATTDRWVVEGSYGDWAEHLSSSASGFLLLNPGLEACLRHQQARPWEPEKYADPADQQAKLPFLLDWTRSYEDRDDAFGLAWHRRALEGFGGPKAEVLDADQARAAVDRWLR